MNNKKERVDIVDFKYMLTDKYKQKKAEQGKIKQQIENLINRTCCFTGHRPDKLFGYDIYTDDYIEIGKLIRQECIRLIEDKGVDRFISGGALGVDTIAFLVVHKLKEEYPHIKNILSIPFKNQPANWFKQADIDRYNLMKAQADEIIYVDLLDKYRIKGYEEDIYYPTKMQRRNEHMCDNSKYTISVWNGVRKGGTWNCVKYARDNGNEVTRIDPRYFETTYNLQYLI